MPADENKHWNFDYLRSFLLLSEVHFKRLFINDSLPYLFFDPVTTNYSKSIFIFYLFSSYLVYFMINFMTFLVSYFYFTGLIICYNFKNLIWLRLVFD